MVFINNLNVVIKYKYKYCLRVLEQVGNRVHLDKVAYTPRNRVPDINRSSCPKQHLKYNQSVVSRQKETYVLIILQRKYEINPYPGL